MFKIIIDAKHVPKYHTRSFGQFKTYKDAENQLKKKGWFENKTRPEKGLLWSVQTHRYTLIYARIGFSPKCDQPTLESPSDLPEWMCDKY